MALSNIDKNHLNKIISIPNLKDLHNDKLIKTIQRNSNNYSKLKVLFKQLNNIKNEIEEIVQETIETENLEQIKCNFKKIPGNDYYLYQNLIKIYFFLLFHRKNGVQKIYLWENIFMIMILHYRKFNSTKNLSKTILDGIKLYHRSNSKL